MKKFGKIISVIVALSMVVCSLAFAACTSPTENSEPEHQHTYAAEWSSNNNKHWHESNCEHKGLKKDEANHDKNGADGACSVCGYKPHVHTYNEAWSTDTVNHWHAASCEHSTLKKDEGAHDTNGEEGGCSVCGYKPAHEHTFGSSYAVNTAKHWKIATCGHLDQKAEEAAHTPGEDGRCTVCNYKPHEDSYEYEWTANKHWQALVCSDVDNCSICDDEHNENVPYYKNIADHTFNADRICTVCGFNGTWQNYNDACITCDTCGGCIKTECVHSSEETHKFCGEQHANAKTVELEAEDGEIFTADGTGTDILDDRYGVRCAVHPDYGNVRFKITVNKACTVTLKVCNGRTGAKFTEKANVFVNGVEFETKNVLAQPKPTYQKLSFVYNTLGCINLKEGENVIEVIQRNGDWNIHIDKIALITPEDVTIGFTPVDNSDLYIIQGGTSPMFSDDAKDLPPAELATRKFQA